MEVQKKETAVKEQFEQLEKRKLALKEREEKLKELE